MRLSVVTTIYQSSKYIEAFYLNMLKAITSLTDDYEIIFVDDGSQDASLKLLWNIQKTNKKIKIIQLSRNFGHHKAMMAGLTYAKGEYVFLIDVDLEEDPLLLLDFWQALQQDKSLDVVYGVQNKRKGRWFERWTGHIYYKVLNTMSDDVKVAENISTVRLMRKNYVNALTQFKENHFYFGPVAILAGFNQKSYYFDKKCKGTSSYNFFKKYHMFLNSIISLSSKPLYFIFYAGSTITAISFIYMVYMIVRQLFWGITIKGWTSLVVLISLFGGINIFFMGIVSAYILHIFQETKNRPFTIVREVYKGCDTDERTNNIDTTSFQTTSKPKVSNLANEKEIL